MLRGGTGRDQIPPFAVGFGEIQVDDARPRILSRLRKKLLNMHCETVGLERFGAAGNRAQDH